jgi:anti-sigma B factor antagonist
MTLQVIRSFDHNKMQWEIAPLGEIDISNAADLRTALDEAFSEQKGDIILEFDQIRYMDSTGLGVIIGAYSRMRELGYHLILRNPRDNIQKLLVITNLDKLLCPELCES